MKNLKSLITNRSSEMDFFVETLKNASLHIHAVWLAIAYIAVILAMTVDFIAGLKKAKLAGKVTTSRTLKMTTEKIGAR